MMRAPRAGTSRPTAPRARYQSRRGVVLRVEALECRTVPTVFTPAQIRQAYGFDQISFPTATGPVVGDGSGQTIAIVDAYDDPAFVSSTDPNFAASDLAHFDATFGLPDPVFTKATPQGTPAVDTGWSSEIALDVEWAHAVAPGANILLVEAKSTSLADLLGAVQYAASQPGVSVVSMSWGLGEFATETGYDSTFTTPGVTFIASSGDAGTPPEWPAISPNVLAVGGTNLALNSGGGYGSETGWKWSGGGVSRYESKPAYQTDVSTPSSTKRTGPDVAYDANPNTGVYMYDSVNGGWFSGGGTSAGAPQWAGLVAIANQGRQLAGQSALDGRTQTLYAVYEAAQTGETTNFHDITSGMNGPGSKAKAGYDTVTGVGSPIANQVVSALVGWTGTETAGSLNTAATSPPPPGGTGGRAGHHAAVSPTGSPVAVTEPAAPTTPPVVGVTPAPVGVVMIPAAPAAAFMAPSVAGDFGPAPVQAFAGVGPAVNQLPAYTATPAPAGQTTSSANYGYTYGSETEGGSAGETTDAWDVDWLFNPASPFADSDTSDDATEPPEGGAAGEPAAEGDLELSGVAVDE